MNDHRLATERNIWLATVRPDGRPHLIPIWFVWLNGRFYLCTGKESVKGRNLQANPNLVLALEDGANPLIAGAPPLCSIHSLPLTWPLPSKPSTIGTCAIRTNITWSSK